jgi:hypothetical protein
MSNQDHGNLKGQDDRRLVAAWLNQPRQRPCLDTLQLAEWLERGAGDGDGHGDDAMVERGLAADPQLLAALIEPDSAELTRAGALRPRPAPQPAGLRRRFAGRHWRRAPHLAHAATLLLALLGGLALGRDLAATRLQTEVRHLQALLAFDTEYSALPGDAP